MTDKEMKALVDLGNLIRRNTLLHPESNSDFVFFVSDDIDYINDETIYEKIKKKYGCRQVLFVNNEQYSVLKNYAGNLRVIRKL